MTKLKSVPEAHIREIYWAPCQPNIVTLLAEQYGRPKAVVITIRTGNVEGYNGVRRPDAKTTFGDRLRATRRNSGLLKKVLLEDLGLKPYHYDQMEKGKVIPSEEMVRRMAAWFDVPLKELRDGQPPEAPPAPNPLAPDAIIDAATKQLTILRGGVTTTKESIKKTSAKLKELEKRLEDKQRQVAEVEQWLTDNGPICGKCKLWMGLCKCPPPKEPEDDDFDDGSGWEDDDGDDDDWGEESYQKSEADKWRAYSNEEHFSKLELAAKNAGAGHCLRLVFNGPYHAGRVIKALVPVKEGRKLATFSPPAKYTIPSAASPKIIHVSSRVLVLWPGKGNDSRLPRFIRALWSSLQEVDFTLRSCHVVPFICAKCELARFNRHGTRVCAAHMAIPKYGCKSFAQDTPWADLKI